jgi:hypothetical protein
MVFQRENAFSGNKNTFSPFIYSSHTGSPAQIRCGRLLAACVWLRRQWLPHAIP